jgi:hypothetical protein
MRMICDSGVMLLVGNLFSGGYWSVSNGVRRAQVMVLESVSSELCRGVE